MNTEDEHGLTCTCGKTLPDPDALTEHGTVDAVLDEVEPNGGEKYATIAEDHHRTMQGGNIQDLADHLDIKLTPENAPKIAKELVTHHVRHHDKYFKDNGGGAE